MWNHPVPVPPKAKTITLRQDPTGQYFGLASVADIGAIIDAQARNYPLAVESPCGIRLDAANVGFLLSQRAYVGLVPVWVDTRLVEAA